MRNKNILIAFGIFGGGIILYKILFNFVLPIVLFVFLGYILKILIKGAEDNEKVEKSKLEEESTNGSLTNNVVPIKPIKEINPSDGKEEVKTTEEVKPEEEEEEVKTTEEVKPEEEKE